MKGQDELPSIQPSNVTGSVSLILGLLTFLLLFIAPKSGLGLIASILAVTVGVLGLTTRGRGRAGFGIVLGVVGGALYLLLLTAIPM
jgi:hypothetical protein